MRDASLLAHRLHEQHDEVPALGLDRVALVEAHRVGAADPVLVVDHHPTVGARRREGLEEAALRREDLVLLGDPDLVGLDLGVRLDAEVVGMDEREMAHVEEVLDRAEPRDVDRDRASRHVDPILLETLGEVRDVPVGLADRGEDMAVPEARGERGARIAPDDANLAGTCARLGDLDRDAKAAPSRTSPSSPRNSSSTTACQSFTRIGSGSAMSGSLTPPLPTAHPAPRCGRGGRRCYAPNPAGTVGLAKRNPTSKWGRSDVFPCLIRPTALRIGKLTLTPFSADTKGSAGFLA